MRRLIGVLVTLVGLVLIVFTFTSSAFLRTDEGERILDRFRPVTSAQGFAVFAADYGESVAAVNELVKTDYPAFARDLGMTEPAFEAYATSHFASVTHGAAGVQALVALVTPVANGVAALPGTKFEPLYNLPIKQLPLTSVPWLFLGLGFALMLVGLAVWRAPGKPTLVLVVIFGLGMVIVPFVISLPSKVDQTVRIIALAPVALTADAATRSEQDTYAADEMVRGINVELLPAIAEKRGTTVDALRKSLETDSPALSKFMADWPTMAPRSFAFAAAIRASVDEVAEAKQFPYKTVPWLVIGLGGALLFFGVVGLAASRRETAAVATG